jgi:histidinol-phosphate aminotransferase
MTARALRASELSRATYRDITLYAPDRTPCAIDLSDNTNLWGVPPSADAALRSAVSVTRYPSLYTPELKRALAAYVGVEPESIVTGCGSDDVLDSAIRAFADPGSRVAHPEPSFAMIPIFARMNGLEPVAVPLRRDLDIDADALLATRARIIYICSPNNPTGTLASPEAIARVIDGADGIVILDEAYAEFAGTGFVGAAPSYENVLVVRTMSKAFGLAGLRIGYACGGPDLVAEVEKSRGPYKVSTIAERAAIAALDNDLEWVGAHVDEALQHRAEFIESLQDMGLSPLPTRANFVLVPVTDAARTASMLREHGIAVRPFIALPGIGDALRITIGPWAMMDACLSALWRALA